MATTKITNIARILRKVDAVPAQAIGWTLADSGLMDSGGVYEVKPVAAAIVGAWANGEDALGDILSEHESEYEASITAIWGVLLDDK